MKSNKKTKLAIKSHIKQRLLKIRSGTVYNGKLTFIKELGQNAFRAKASKVWVTIEDDTFIIKDNGIGCDDPEKLFTLDFSGFGIGFGEGFNSIYMIADWFKVETLDWSGELNVIEKLDNPRTTEQDLAVDITEGQDYVSGFTLTLKGEQIRAYAWDIMNEVRHLFQYNPTIDAYINGELVEKQNLYDKVQTGDYWTEVDNHLYSGKISLTSRFFDTGIHVYYEYRLVQELHIDGAKGVIQLKPNAVNLRAPDRTYIINDKKRERLVKKLEKDIKPLFKKLVVSGTKQDIDDYAKLVKEYLTVKEYIDYLDVDISFLPKTIEKAPKDVETKQTMKADDFYKHIEETQVYGGNPSASVNMESKLTVPDVSPTLFDDENVAVVLGHESPAYFLIEEAERPLEEETSDQENASVETGSVAIDTVRHIDDTKFRSHVVAEEYVKKEQLSGINIKTIKKKKNIVWCSVDEKEKYQHFISQFEYNNVYTFISPHELYDEALRHLRIPHVSEFENCIVEDHKVTKTGARNKKEERATELLAKVEKKYNLPETFFLSSIDCVRKIELNGKKVHQEKVTVYGYEMAGYIHLNRKHLYFGDIRGSRLGEEKLNVHDLKFIVANASLIAHELAHLLYGTKDNTKEHYEAEIRLRDEIVRTAIEEWS